MIELLVRLYPIIMEHLLDYHQILIVISVTHWGTLIELSLHYHPIIVEFVILWNYAGLLLISH